MAKFLPKDPPKDVPIEINLSSARDFALFINTARKAEELQHFNATAVLSKSLFSQLFAEFDAFIGELLTTIYLLNDALLKGISREITLSELMDHEDLRSVKKALLEKEIDSFRRDSYVDQFSSLEKKFSIPLRKFKEWPAFVELSQRRNILTHNGGLISEQYIAVCEREGYKFDKRPVLGHQVAVNFQYFAEALRLVTKVGFMLAYTLWSKVFPKDLPKLHDSLNDTIYNCLRGERWKLVAELSDFVLSDAMRKGTSEIDLRVRIINSAIGLKFADRSAEALALLASIDWTASYRDFKLALAVLEERYEDAVALMKSIGKKGEILQQHSYHTWPLFTKFRERSEFYDAYREIYGENFAEKVETKSGPLEAHAVTGRPVVDVVATEVSETTAVRASRPRRAPSVKKAKRIDVPKRAAPKAR